MVVSFVGSAVTAPATAATGADVTLPARQTGDLILLQASINRGAAISVTTAPTGFTQIAYNGNEAALTTVLYQRIADTSQDINPHIEWATSGQIICIAAVYRGVDTTNPLIPAGGALQEHTASSSASHPAPAITNTDAGAWAVYFGAARQVATPLNWSPPTGLTERADIEIGLTNTANMAATLADSNGTVATGTNTYTGTTNGNSAQATAFAAYLKPAAAGGGGNPAVGTLVVDNWTEDQALFEGYDTNRRVNGPYLDIDAVGTYPGVQSVSGTYSLVGSSLAVEVPQVPNFSNGSTEAHVEFWVDANNGLAVGYNNGNVYMRRRVAGVNNDSGYTPYNATNHRYWRIAEASGTITWSVSADRVNWTTLRSEAAPFAVTAGRVRFDAGNYNAAPDPGFARFAAINTTTAIGAPAFTGSGTLTATGTVTSGGGAGLTPLTFTVGTAYEATTTVDTGTATLASGYTTGDYTLLVCSLTSGTGTINTPAGWSEVLPSTIATANTSHVHAIFYRKWVSGDPTTVDVACSNGRLILTPVRVRGADATTFLEVSAAVTQTSGTTTAVVAPSVTSTASGTMIYTTSGRSGVNGTFITWTPDASATEIAENGSKATAATNSSHSLNTSTVTAGVASGTKTSTASSNTNGGMGVSFVIKQAAASAPAHSGSAAFTGTGTLTATGSLPGSGAYRLVVRPAVSGANAQLVRGDGQRAKLAGICVWGLSDIVTGQFGNDQYTARATVINTIKAWGANHIRFRILANNANSSTDVARLQEWVRLASEAGLYSSICWWDSLDGYAEDANWPTRYTSAFPQMASVVAALGADNPYVFYEPFNEPNSFGTWGSTAQWDQWLTAMKATLDHFRVTCGYKGVLAIDTIDWSHGWDDSYLTQLETYDAGRAGMTQHNLMFCKHDYANEYPNPDVFDASKWAADTGGSTTNHVLYESEFGNYNGDASTVHPSWSASIAGYLGDAVWSARSNYAGATPFVFGPWYDANALTAADNVTATTWGNAAKDFLTKSAVTGLRPPSSTQTYGTATLSGSGTLATTRTPKPTQAIALTGTGSLVAYSAAAAGGTQTITYTADTTTIIRNPERGVFHYTETHYRTDNSGHSAVDATALATAVAAGRTQVFRYFYLEKYLSTDTIDQTYLNLVAADLATIRAGGAKAIIRFAYTNVDNQTYPYGNPDPVLSRVQAHIAALAPVINTYADAVEAVQAGLIGLWGEWYYTANYATTTPWVLSAQNQADRNAILTSWLSGLDPRIFLLVRYAGIVPNFFGQTTRPVDATLGGYWDRMGYHDDALGASDDDWGTFSTFPWSGWSSIPADAKAFVQGKTGVPFGGEIASNNVTYPAFTTLMSTYRANFWNPSDFGGSQATQGWTQANQDDTARKLGYRLRLVSATLPASGQPGSSVTVSVTVANDGWGAMLRARPMILDFVPSSGSTVSVTVPGDLRSVGPGAQVTFSGTVTMPNTTGTYTLYLRIPDTSASLAGNAAYTVRLANTTTTWDGATGRNALGATATVAGTPPVDATVTAPRATATATGRVPVVTGTTTATVTAIRATATGAATAPAVTATAAGTVLAPRATATSTAIPPTVGAGTTVGVPRATATATATTPAVVAASGALVQAVPATGTATARPVTVGAGAAVQVLVATATAVARPPTLGGISARTIDISIIIGPTRSRTAGAVGPSRSAAAFTVGDSRADSIIIGPTRAERN